MAAPLVPDNLWAAVSPLLPLEPARPKGGRPRVPDRAALAGIIFVLRTGIQWREVPAEMGCSGKTCWRRLVEWHGAGVWTAPHRVLLERLRGADRLDWRRWTALPCARQGGRGDRAQPDGPRQAGHQAPPRRGRRGHAARPDTEPGQLPRRQDAGPDAGRRSPGRGRRGRPRRRPDKLHADKGYDHRRCRRECRDRGIVPRIARRGIDSGERLGRHRWKVERTVAWLAQFRRLAIRHGRRADVHLALTTLACAIVCTRQVRRFCH